MMLPLLVVTAAMAASPAAASPAEGNTVRFHVAQARQFMKNQWVKDAAREIEAALALPDGPGSFDVNWLGAQIYYELVDIDRALPLARRAAALAPGDGARADAENFSTFLRDTFGWVRVSAPHDDLVSRLQIECTSMVLDPDLKRLINKVSLQVRERTVLPTRIALPAGEYLVNGESVTVTPGQTGEVRLGLDQIGSRGLAALQVTRLEISSGLGVLFGDRVANLHPAAVFELSLTQPVGPLLVGVVGDYDLRGYSAGNGRDGENPLAWSAGVRVGHELVLGGPLGLRPSAGLRYGMVPGIGFGCADGGGGDSGDIACVPLSDEVAELEIYAVGRAWTPFAELSLEYREAGRTTALGAGVKAVIDHSFGSVASPGEAALFDDSDGATQTFTAEPAVWSATGIRLLANLSIAF